MVVPCNYPQDSCTRSTPSTCRLSPRSAQEGVTGDVHFIVGPEGDTWMIPGCKRLLIEFTEIFAAMLNDGRTTVRIADVDKRGFEHLIRHSEGSEIKFTSVQTARTTLDVAYKFECLSLVQICVSYLDLNLDVSNVLSVYKNLSVYCNNNFTNEPSAPTLHATQLNETATAIRDWCTKLMHNCLLFIDQEANEILSKDEFETLSEEDMKRIVSREFLQLKNELILFDSILRWFKCFCMKNNKILNRQAREEHLGSLIFKVRYGLMTKSQLINGPGASSIFSEEEIRKLLDIIDNPICVPEQELCNTNKPRLKNKVGPNHLSLRTEPAMGSKTKAVKSKKDKSKISNFTLNCLTVWTALFD